MYNGRIDEPYKLKCGLFRYVATLSMVIFSNLHEKDRELLDRMFRKNEPTHKRADLPEENTKNRRR